MKPSNQYTTPEQRFVIPHNSEVQHHSSFEAVDLPSVEALRGGDTYIVTRHETDGMTRAYRGTTHPSVPSGNVITQIAMTEYGLAPRDDFGFEVMPPPEDLSLLDQAHTTYDLRPGDLLILQADRYTLPGDSSLPEHMDLDGVLLLPANEPLPFSVSSTHGGAIPVDFLVHGVITPDLRLVTWPTIGGGGHSRRLIDLCIINRHVQNPVELALLQDATDSLSGELEGDIAAATYLRYFDKTRGTIYWPETDPFRRGDELGRMGADQYARYSHIAMLVSRRAITP